jgi:hypothetical protein
MARKDDNTETAAQIRAGGRALWKDAGSKRALVGRKSSPERMTKLLDQLMKFPQVNRACAMVGISYCALKYWLVKSEKGRPGDGFDITYGEETKRFHEHYSDVRDAAVQAVEDAFMDRAMRGYYETLSDKGRVIYQIDPSLANLGLTGPDAYLLDDDGRPIPERIQHQDPEVMLSVLKAWRRDRYGAKDTLDVNVKGGVMVVGMRAATSAEVDQRERAMITQKPIDVDFREVEDE